MTKDEHIVELQEENKVLRNKLTEAKEIIRELLEWEDRSDYGEHLYQSDPELLSKAEAFVKEQTNE